MKKILFSLVVAMTATATFAALEPINEGGVYFGQTALVQDADNLKPDLANMQTKAVDMASHNLADPRALANNPTMERATMQTLTSALPQMTADGLKIQLQGSTISYGTINMSTGDLTKMPMLKEMPTIKP